MPQADIAELIVTAEQRALVPHFDQFLGIWAIDENAFLGHAQWAKGLVVLNQLEMHVHGQQAAAAQERAAEGSLYPVSREGIARIDLRGTLMKQSSSFNSSGSTVLARRKMRSAAADAEVAGIALVIDSPGGTVAGTKELADEVAAAAEKKPVYAFIEDLGASAAYWIASGATKVFANETALVGSIGTYGVVHDLSAMAAKEGIKVHVVRAGEFKGAGTPGTEISAEFLAHYQTLITDLNEHFLAGVAQGRKLGLAQVRTLADGRVHIAAKAKELGLVDGVQSLDATIAQLAKVSAKPRKGPTMSESIATAAAEIKPAAATIPQIRQACKGCDEKFILAQVEAGATLEQAKDAWIGEQSARLEASRQETEAARAAANKPGVPRLASETAEGNDGTATGNSMIDQFQAEVEREMERSKCDQHVAHATVCRKRPDLRMAYVAAHNSLYPQRRGRRAS